MNCCAQGHYDVIVCGAGHAGCEAALAAARMGCQVLLLSGNLDTVAQMSCNPAIGGQAKGHIVREIDALGGEMAINTDTTAIQFRVLNESKGPAVQSPRAQCDKKAYQFRFKHALETQPNLHLFQAMATGLLWRQGRISGVRTNLEIDFTSRTVVITTGTFLRALLHVGNSKNEGGRMGDFTARDLSGSLIEAGIKLDRLKTGTPPRILGASIDFAKLEYQPGDERPVFFAFYDTRFGVETPAALEARCAEEGVPNPLFHVEHPGQRRLGWRPGENQMACWITYTSAQTEEIIRRNLHRSALYGGEIRGIGPRYCPSIEDKIVKFADKDRHRLFLEPEGRNTEEWYINGLSTSLPFDVQVQLVQSIPGLEKAVIVRPAYAVEYDFAPPTQLLPSLESRCLEGLFFAGQINGTSGYEEAAGQGLLAGINAALKIRGENPIVLGRHEAYIGVLIDDLVTKGTVEPYRMFTSRAEYRLLLNHGSAELRLYHAASRLASMPVDRLQRISSKMGSVQHWEQRLEKMSTGNGTIGAAIRRGEDEDSSLPPEFQVCPRAVREEVLYRVRYRGYIEREQRQVDRLAESHKILLPVPCDYNSVHGLRNESRTKLQAAQPVNLAQAARLSGVNPADIAILWVAARSGQLAAPLADGTDHGESAVRQ